MMFPRFIFPWALLLLALVPWSVWLGARMRSMRPGRKWTAIVLRAVILFCLVAALAGMELVRTEDNLAVFYLVDHSNSVPEETRLAAAQAVNQTCLEHMGPRDRAGIIVFGEDASIEVGAEPYLQFDNILSYVGGEQTDIAAAVRLAMAAFPQGAMKRIVLVTDGNETRGSALEEVKLAQAEGVEVDILPVDVGQANEVRIRSVESPSQVNADEPFKVKVVVNARQDSAGKLRLYQRVRSGKRLLQTADVTLQEGDNSFLLPQELSTAGFYEYEATIESESDTVMANNEGRAFSVIQGEPRVLYIEADREHSTRLQPALEQEGLVVDTSEPAALPDSLAQLQNYDAVVLSNVSSTDLTANQMRSLEAMVRDMGIGLVMIGGPNSFGAGGFHETPVEEALPVSMDLKQRKILPRGALVLIMHTCEIPDGNAWSREIGIAALNVLASQDLMGALAYTGQGDDWLYKLQPVGDKHLMRLALSRTDIGDMPAVQPTMQKAYDALVAADAAVKRMVLISDGDPSPPTRGLLQNCVDAKIAVSTVCISPHSPSDQQMLSSIAQITGGNFYFVTNSNNLPQIFTKEATVVKRGMLIEEPFVPALRHASELTQTYAGSGFPELLGYVATTPKDNATIALVSHEDDPVLAHWRYGLGKAVAFTSDVTSRWAPNWMSWGEFNRFWMKTVRWAMREFAPSDFRVETRVEGALGRVRVDAVDDQGRFVNFLRPEGIVTGPAPEFRRQELALLQTGPGIYEGTFPLDERGIYMINLTYTNADGSQGTIPAGLALDYSREYEYNTINLPLIEQLAAAGDGEIVEATFNPFVHNLTATPIVTTVWPYLLAAAALLLPVEIFIRRVVLDFAAAFAWLGALVRRIPLLRRLAPAPRPRTAQVTGVFGDVTESRHLAYTPADEGLLEGGDGKAAAQAVTVAPGDALLRTEEKKLARQESAPGYTEYTQRLLAAKERALKKKRGSRSGDDEQT